MKTKLISVTSLSSYLYCPRKLFMEKVLRIIEPPKEALVKGTVRHDFYDMINKKEEEIVTGIKKEILFENLLDIYKNEHSVLLRTAITKNKDSLAKFNIQPIEMFRQVWPLVIEESKTRSLNVFNFSLLFFMASISRFECSFLYIPSRFSNGISCFILVIISSSFLLIMS